MPLPTLQAQERQHEYTRTLPAASRNLAVRIRSIKPEFWRSTDITNLTLEDRLLFIGLWSYVDDNGVGKDELPVVVADLFAGDMFRDPRETVARVSRGLSNLFSAGLIDRYQVDGKSFLMIVQWAAHQRIDKPAKERFPRSDGDTEVIRDTLATPSRDSRDTLAPGTGEQGSRGTGNRGAEEQAERARLRALAESAYEAWPRKEKREPSIEKFLLAAKRIDPDLLHAHVLRFAEAYRTHKTRQFTPALVAWLNQGRWTDELPTAEEQRGAVTTTDRNLSYLQRLAAEEASGQMLEIEGVA